MVVEKLKEREDKRDEERDKVHNPEKKIWLEQLLNSLIKRWRVPFGESRIDKINRAEQYVWNWNWCCRGRKDAIQKRKSTRQLVSRESLLWQFVCENGMINNVWNFVFRRLRDGKKFWLDKPITHFTYRLIESSLKDESELEDFLLSNIKVEWK